MRGTRLDFIFTLDNNPTVLHHVEDLTPLLIPRNLPRQLDQQIYACTTESEQDIF